MQFAVKWMELEIIILSKASQVQKDKSSHVFSHMWNINLNDKCIYKYTYDHIYI
jgi:hypothetical protein